MLKRLAQFAIGPLIYGLVLLVIGYIAYRPLEPTPPPTVVLNGEVLVFPRDYYKLEAEQARLEAESAATLRELGKMYPSDGEHHCPVPMPPLATCGED